MKLQMTQRSSGNLQAKIFHAVSLETVASDVSPFDVKLGESEEGGLFHARLYAVAIIFIVRKQRALIHNDRR